MTTMLGRLAEHRAEAQAGGGTRRVEAQHEKGKLTARERIFDQLQAGDKKGAALSIAQYEQTEVVPPLYQQYGTTFLGIESALSFSSHMPFTSDPASIPLSYECGASPTIPFNGSINNTNDRVNYYNSLYDAAFPN